MATVIKEGPLCLLGVKGQGFKKTKYWVELSTTPQEHVYRLCLYYDKVPRVPWRLFCLERDTFCGSECGVLNKRVNDAEERYWALVLDSCTLLFQEVRGRKSGPDNGVEVWDKEVRRRMRDRGRWMCQSVQSPDPSLPDEFVINLTEASLSFTSLMTNMQSAQSHGLWDIAQVEVDDPEYQNVSQEDGQFFLKLIIGQPGKRRGVYIVKLPPRARLELVTKLRMFQSRLGPPTRPRPGSSDGVQSRPLPIPPPPTDPRPPTHLSHGVSPRTQPTPTQPSHGASPPTQLQPTPTQPSPRLSPHPKTSRSPSPTHRALSPPFRKAGLGSNPPTSLGKCPSPPLAQKQAQTQRLPTSGPHSKRFHKPVRAEKRPLPSTPNVASSANEHTTSSRLSSTGCPPPVPYRRSESQTSDGRRVLPTTPSPTQEDKSMKPRSTDPGLPSTLKASCPPNIVVDEFKDAAAAAQRDANSNKCNGLATQEKPLLPKKRAQRQKEERRYKNVPDRTIDRKPTEHDMPYYSIVPMEKDNGATENSHATSVQRPSDRHVYMNAPTSHVSERSRVYMKCMSNEDHHREDAQRLKVAANVKRSGSMPLLTDLPDPSSMAYYNIPDLKAEPLYQNPSLRGRKATRCPPPPSEAPGDGQKKPVPAPRRATSRQELNSIEYHDGHPTTTLCKEQQHQDSTKKDIMSVLMDTSLEEDTLGLPKEKWEKLLLLLCYPSPLQNDWRVLASRLDLNNVDVMLLESVRENYKQLPARYVFRYWQRHGPLPYTRQEVQRVLIELERLELAGMFDDYCTLPLKPVL
ncbi:serine/arginine repetitive matrix protein 1-like [Branchiostoma floridae]|uniref:Serine/arginine repetitive matrix protein 1-like n=1 Tax=Branchiostoma floridae TaxID=7739 RepID=A0A9J7M7R4_BRAFL|nr:serine/arginine repetitive matrix protein 1-like [Branchiostoma floridae]